MVATALRRTVSAARTGPGARTGGRAALALVVAIGVSQAAGLVGVPFTDRAQDGWYDQLDKPSFTPPSWVFAPVWTSLYALMGLAAWLVWRRPDGPARTTALALFVLQLVLNAAWTPLFFGAQRPALALVELAALDAAAEATTVAFARVDRRAAALLVPYLAWLGFATLLNAGIVIEN